MRSILSWSGEGALHYPLGPVRWIKGIISGMRHSWRFAMAATLVSALLAAAALGRLLMLLIALELASFAVYLFETRVTMRRPQPPPPVLTPTQRERVLQLACTTVPSAREFTINWFRLKGRGGYCTVADFGGLRRDNVEEFLAWGFWFRQVKDVNAKQLNKMIALLEHYCAKEDPEFKRFPPGRNSDLCVLRFNEEPVKCNPKPAFIYICLEVLWLLGAMYMRWNHFRYRCRGDIAYWVRGGRFRSGARVESKRGSRGRRAAVSREGYLFFHGIGVGFVPYIRTLLKIANRIGGPGGDGGVVIAVEAPEQPKVSITTRMTQPSVFADDVETILRAQNLSRVHVVSHSFGTIHATWLMRLKPRLVADCVLVDPVCLLLQNIKTMWNFCYNEEGTLVHNFMTRDSNIAYRLRRRFWWYQNVLWLEDLPRRLRAMVVLSKQDEYVPSELVERYVRTTGRKHTQLMVMEKAHHGDPFLAAEINDKLTLELFKFWMSAR